MKAVFVILSFATLGCVAIHYIDPRPNMWVTWANTMGQQEFCLSLQSAGDPFKTCLIGFPEYDPRVFSNYTTANVSKCTTLPESNCSALLLKSANVSLPWDPQELELLGSMKVGNVSRNWTQTCVYFGNTQQGINVYRTFNRSGWTDVSPLASTSFQFVDGVGSYCGYNDTSKRGLGAWGAAVKGNSGSLWNNGTPKALPDGIFLICGDRAWQGVPGRAIGGPCYLGKLTLLAPNHRQWLNVSLSKRQKRTIHVLGPDCNDQLALWSVTARVFASLFTPGVAAAKALGDLEKLACWSLKQANDTDRVLQELLLDTKSLRHAVLQNSAAIDFLLLAHGHGCEDVEGMCCFNLSDHSESIQKRLNWLTDHTRKILKDDNPLDTWLTSLLGSWSGLFGPIIKEGLRFLLILVLVIIVCKIVYHCIMSKVKALSESFVVVKENGGIVGEWAQEKGLNSAIKFAEHELRKHR